MERGRHRIFLDQVYAAAHALGVTIEDLLPTVAEVFPATYMTASPSGAITDKSMRSAVDIVRTIQEKAALEYATREAAQSKRTLSGS